MTPLQHNVIAAAVCAAVTALLYRDIRSIGRLAVVMLVVALGYSRILFAAARDSQFFPPFARLHPTKHFPHVSLLTIGAVTMPFCFFTLGQLVNWLIQVQILLQFVWQCAAVILLRRYRPDIAKPFRMWLYPLPARVSLAMWLYIFFSAPFGGIVFSVVFLGTAVAACFVFDRKQNGRTTKIASVMPSVAWPR
jgi:amino acid transporter